MCIRDRRIILHTALLSLGTVATSHPIHALKMVFNNLLLLLFGATLLASASEALTTVIYVDPDNGTMDPTCWTGRINLPCKDYDLAKEGALYLKVNVQIIPSKTKTC